MKYTKYTNKFAFKENILLYLAILFTVAVAGQTPTINKDYLESYQPLTLPNGDLVKNMTGETLYLFNNRQYAPLYELWQFSQDSAFVGNEAEMFAIWRQYLHEQDSLLAGLQFNHEEGRRINRHLKESNQAAVDSLKAAISQLEKGNEGISKSTDNINMHLDQAKKPKKERTFFKDFGKVSFGAVVGILSGFLIFK